MSSLWMSSSMIALIVVLCVADANGQYDTTQYITSIVFDRIQNEVYLGEHLSFTGTLYSDDAPLSDKVIQICRHNLYTPDDCFTSGKTNLQGQFVIPWIVEAETPDFDVYAVFGGDAEYRSDRSTAHTLSILKHGGYLVLDDIPYQAYVGDVITFSGVLNLDGRDTTGAIVYIKERDTVSADDILGNAYVNGTGHYSTDWRVVNTDSDESIEIYAVFEGNDVYHKISTCDSGQTMSTHQACQDLPILQSPSVASDLITNEPYIEIEQPLELKSTLRVAIISNAGDYHTDVIESIELLTTALKDEYGGGWDIQFEVITQNELFYQEYPDIIMHIVTPETCEYHMDGHVSSGPVQVTVCIDDANVDIKHETLHQFKHAIGIGHTFNTPDHIGSMALASIVLIYGTDGFLLPNNLTPDAIFTARDYQDMLHLTEISGSSYSSNTGGIKIVPSMYEPGQSIHIQGWYWDEYSDMATIIVIDPNNNIVDVFDMNILNDHIDMGGRDAGVLYDGFDEYISGYYVSGTYKIRMYDGSGKLSASNAFEITGFDGTPPNMGVAFTNELVYTSGEDIHITVLHSDKYEGFSNITITDSGGDVVESLYIHTVDGTVRTHIDGYVNAGAYNIQVYNEDGEFIDDTTFHITDVVSKESYTGSIYTNQIQYGLDEQILIDGKYDRYNQDHGTVIITNQDGHIVDILDVDVADGLFSLEVLVDNYGTYHVSVYDHAGSFVTDTRFYVVPPHTVQVDILDASDPNCNKVAGCFAPLIVHISKGETVSWTNHDTILHSATSGSITTGLDDTFDSGLISPGGMFVHTFDEEGVYPYFCMVHPWKSSVVIVK